MAISAMNKNFAAATLAGVLSFMPMTGVGSRAYGEDAPEKSQETKQADENKQADSQEAPEPTEEANAELAPLTHLKIQPAMVGEGEEAKPSYVQINMGTGEREVLDIDNFIILKQRNKLSKYGLLVYQFNNHKDNFSAHQSKIVKQVLENLRDDSIVPITYIEITTHDYENDNSIYTASNNKLWDEFLDFYIYNGLDPNNETTEKLYLPYGAVWINNERFMDYSTIYGAKNKTDIANNAQSIAVNLITAINYSNRLAKDPSSSYAKNPLTASKKSDTKQADENEDKQAESQEAPEKTPKKEFSESSNKNNADKEKAKEKINPKDILVPYRDVRDKNYPKRVVQKYAGLASAKNDSIVFIFYANGKASENQDDFKERMKDSFDSEDSEIYKELKIAAQKLIAGGHKFSGILITNDYNGTDEMECYIYGGKVFTSPTLTAGYGGVTENVYETTLDRLIMADDVKRKEEAKKKMEDSQEADGLYR